MVIAAADATKPRKRVENIIVEGFERRRRE